LIAAATLLAGQPLTGSGAPSVTAVRGSSVADSPSTLTVTVLAARAGGMHASVNAATLKTDTTTRAREK
jgi:hypothetical protein